MFSLSKGDCKSPSVCLCVHPALNENVSEAIVWRFFLIPSSKDGRMSRFREFPSLYEKVLSV